MRFDLAKDWLLWIIILLPFAYLAYHFPTLPEEVPLHWNSKGEIDRYGPKQELWLIPVLLPLLTYLILLVVPRIDPKGQVQKMAGKYIQLKFWITFSMSALAVIIIHIAIQKEMANINLIFAAVGLLFLVLGKSFYSLKPNYFIGIRTPWTLESEEVWIETHRFAAKFWLGGGLLILFGSLLLDPGNMTYLVLGVTLLLVLIPLVFSYRKFQANKLK